MGTDAHANTDPNAAPNRRLPWRNLYHRFSVTHTKPLSGSLHQNHLIGNAWLARAPVCGHAD
jgi:hypothetical protein